MVATVAAGTMAKYYLRQSEYYVGGGEKRGRWTHVGFVSGPVRGSVVEAAELERLHAALDGLGRPMLPNKRGRPERVGGYDVTCSAPKTVSVLWALSDGKMKREIELAQSTAVARAIDVLQANAAFCRFAKGGARREKVRLTVAQFQHGDARPAEHADGQIFADPNLHTHAVVLNLSQKMSAEAVGRASGKNSRESRRGRFGALDGKAIFAWKMALGAAYHLELSKELQSLGFAVEKVGKNGVFEVAGIDDKLKDYFSARRHAVENELEKSGLISARAPALAAGIARATRKAKRKLGDRARFDRWARRAGEQGFPAREVQSNCEAAGRELRNALNATDREARLAERLRAIPDDLTAHDSTFERRKLYSAVATALVGSSDGCERIDREIDRFLADQKIVALARDVCGHQIFTTPELQKIELEIGAIARRLGQSKGPAPDAELVERSIASRRLSGEQAEAVRAATAGDTITIIEGAPGSGKTTTLGPIKELWEAAGYRVIGAATAWKIAHMLRDDLGIEARATDSWLARAANGAPFLDGRTVLILDEAGLMSSRQMHSFLSAFDDHAGERPRLIMVGDRGQMQSVGAGSGLRLAAAALPVQAVEAIQRQRETWAREAILALGKGDAETALAAYSERGRLHEHDTLVATIRALVDAWFAATRTAPAEKCLLIAQTNAQVRAIASEVRARLRDIGALTGEDVTLEAVTPSGHGYSLSLAAGDRVRFLTRARVGSRDVINGTEARIDRIEARSGDSPIFHARVGAETFYFTPSDIEDKFGRVRLAHAYSTTIFGSQGLTTDRAMVLLAPEMDRHAAYVAASRARLTTDFFIDRASLEAKRRADLPLSERAAHLADDDETRRAYLSKCLSRSGLKATTLDILTMSETLAPAVADAPQSVASNAPTPDGRQSRTKGLSLE